MSYHPFHTTRWSLVRAAGAEQTLIAHDAMKELCANYWYPLYAFIRRSGYKPQDAEDLTQGFFTRLIEKHDLKSADQSRGRFRTFLLACLKHYIANEYDKANAQKRGGGIKIISLLPDFDSDKAEQRYAIEPQHDITPEAIYERRWALIIIEKVLDELKRLAAGVGKLDLYNAIVVFISPQPSGSLPSYQQIAEQFDMTEDAVKTMIYRMRRKMGDSIRAEIAQTLNDPKDIDDELKRLFKALQIKPSE